VLLKELFLFGQLCVLYKHLPGRRRSSVHSSEGWVDSILWPSDIGGAPSLRAMVQWRLAGVSILVIHSPGKTQHYLTNLVSGKSNNLIALYNLVNDTL
jgi:hypothetical protein